MPRGRKQVVLEKDFDKLISDAEKRIDDAKHKIETEKKVISEQKKFIKQLQKEKAVYEQYKAEIEKRKRIEEFVNMIEASGKSLDEIEGLIKWNSDDDEENNEVEN